MKLRIACTSFSSLANCHLFVSPQDCIRNYVKKITKQHDPNYELIEIVSNEIRNTKMFNVFVTSKIITQKNREDSRRICSFISAKHKLFTNRPFSIFSKARGIFLEPIGRSIYSRKAGKFSRVHERVNIDFDDFSLRGEIDGVCGGRVIEIKNRCGKYFYSPFHDLIQLATYCYILKMDGTLVEFNSEMKLRETFLSLKEAGEIIKKLLPTVIENINTLLVGLHVETFRSHSVDSGGTQSERLSHVKA